MYSVLNKLSEYIYFWPQLVKSSAIVIRAHIVKVYNNYASKLIIFKVSRHFFHVYLLLFPIKKCDIHFSEAASRGVL